MKSNQALAAKMIREYMKKHGIKGAVTSKGYAHGSSVSIYTNDTRPQIAKELRGYAKQFEYGHFDGMTDCYEMSNVRSDLPQVQFVTVNNDMTLTFRAKVHAFAERFYGLGDAATDTRKLRDLLYTLYTEEDSAFWMAEGK